jgi:hypothetical protein
LGFRPFGAGAAWSGKLLAESWKCCLIAALVVVVLWSLPALAAKIDRFTDQEGTLHITNAGKEEPIKPATGPAVGPGQGRTSQAQAAPRKAPDPRRRLAPGQRPGADPRVRPPSLEAGHTATSPDQRRRPPRRLGGLGRPGPPPGGIPGVGDR